MPWAHRLIKMLVEPTEEDKGILLQPNISQLELLPGAPVPFSHPVAELLPEFAQQLQYPELGRQVIGFGFGFKEGTDEPGVRAGAFRGHGFQLLLEGTSVKEFLELFVEMTELGHESGSITGIRGGYAGEEGRRRN